MLNQSELIKCREASITSCDISSLADLRNITVDTSKPVPERIESFLNQVRNPYLFKVDDVIVKVHYGSGKPVSDALAAALRMG